MSKESEAFFSKEEAQGHVGKKVILKEGLEDPRVQPGIEGRIIGVRPAGQDKFSVEVEWRMEEGAYPDRTGKIKAYNKTQLEKETQLENISPERLKDRFEMEARMEKFAQKLEERVPERKRGLDGPSR